jgi:hypothetical protein
MAVASSRAMARQSLRQGVVRGRHGPIRSHGDQRYEKGGCAPVDAIAAKELIDSGDASQRATAEAASRILWRRFQNWYLRPEWLKELGKLFEYECFSPR